jgi:hypothetical protein
VAVLVTAPLSSEERLHAYGDADDVVAYISGLETQRDSLLARVRALRDAHQAIVYDKGLVPQVRHARIFARAALRADDEAAS